MKKMYAWILGLGVGFCLLQGHGQAAGLPVESVELPTTMGLVADSDGDGVDDAVDLCPGTPAGTAVNAYGCPISLTSCDYTTSTVSLVSSGGSTGATVSTQYVLASSAGTILQISPTASFSGLSGTATYMAVAVTYDGVATNLMVGSALSAVTASCLDWSDALVFKACVPPTPSCDYQIGDNIVLKSAGGSTTTGTKTSYVLTDAKGVLVKVSASPTFSTTDLVAGGYTAYALIYTDDNSISSLTVDGVTKLSQVTASCLAVSSGLSLQLCGGCVTACVPLVVTRIR